MKPPNHLSNSQVVSILVALVTQHKTWHPRRRHLEWRIIPAADQVSKQRRQRRSQLLLLLLHLCYIKPGVVMGLTTTTRKTPLRRVPQSLLSQKHLQQRRARTDLFMRAFDATTACKIQLWAFATDVVRVPTLAFAKHVWNGMKFPYKTFMIKHIYFIG